MTLKLKKYFFKSFALILLTMFLLSNVSFCQLVMLSCKSEISSCCCKKSNETPRTIKIEKQCCCEIKEASNQPLDVTTALVQIQNKNITFEIHQFANYSFADAEGPHLSYKPISFHSPPAIDLNILNSNFRI